MLWYKSWLDTRWRFVIGLVLLLLSACGSVLAYPKVMELVPLAPATDVSGEIGRRIREAIGLSSTYRGYVWSQWFSQNMLQLMALFAILLGTGGPLSQASGRGTLFTLSLPTTRDRLLGVRAATGLLELLALALLPSLLVPVLSPAIGQTYGAGDALIHAGCMFTVGAVFFSLALLLSTVFLDIWRPLLIVICIACVLAVAELFVPALAPYSILRVMTGEAYFRGSGLPWMGLLVSTAASAAFLYSATVNIARQDF
jgi:hypothetical protein